MRKKILITGSSGFLGDYVVKEAQAKGYDVLGFDKIEPKNATYEYIVGNILDNYDVHSAFTYKPDYVINLAANASAISMDYDNNVIGFLKVIEASAKHNVKRFVYASTSGIYNNTFNEDKIVDIKALTNHYSKTKFIDELIAQSYTMEYPSMKVIGTRVFNAYGLGESKKGFMKDSPASRFINQMLNGKPMTIYGDGTQTVDLIEATDVGKIYIKLLEKAENGIYNIGTGKATSINRLAEIIGGKSKHVNPPSTNMVNISEHKAADTRKLFKTIGNYKFISIETGIKRFIENLRLEDAQN